MRLFCIATLIVTVSTGPAWAVTGSILFQNGVNGYAGTIDRLIDERGGAAERNGSDWPQIFLDGFTPAVGTTAFSPDAQALVRFDNLFGTGPGQIPMGATILEANFTVKTSTTTNAQTNGGWGVAQLLQPFTATTVHADFPNFLGPWHTGGLSKRVRAAFQGPAQGESATVDIASMVQDWSNNPANNHGLAIQAGFIADGTITGNTTDGWGIISTGHPVVDWRPQLEVTYTTDPITLRSYQRGDANGYANDTNAMVRSGANVFGIQAYDTTPADPNHHQDDITWDGLTGAPSVAPDTTITEPTQGDFRGWADGLQFENNAAGVAGTANSFEDFGLFKFDNVFGAGAAQSPADLPVAKAWLVLTTGESLNTAGDASNAQSNGAFTAHGIKRDWDTTTLHSDFGDNPGLQLPGADGAGGDITPALDEETGMLWGSEVWFDVTEHLEDVRTGAAPNYGFAVRTGSTADGWQYHMNGFADAALRPRLVVASGNPAIVVPELAGDYNSNGVVDAADYVTWRNNLDQSVTLPNDSTPGTVTQADYDVWRANFGNTADIGGPLGSGAAVPEPHALVLGLFAAAVCSIWRNPASR